MKFHIIVIFYENDEKVALNDTPIQEKFTNIVKTKKFKIFLEENISNMGSACKNKVSHYLEMKINKIVPIVKKSFFWKSSLELEIDAEISQIKKKVVGEMWCGKKLNEKEIKELFNEDNILQHIDTSVKELSRGEPFKIFKGVKGKKYHFYFDSAY